MKLVVTGLSAREEAAFGVFLTRFKRNWTWESVAAQRGAVLPKADLMVVDLVPWGLAQWSQTAEADLLQLLQGTPAVLLVPSHDRTWGAMEADTATSSRVWLSKPYGTKEMQEALEQVATSISRAALNAPVMPVPVPSMIAPQMVSAVPRAMVLPPRLFAPSTPPVITPTEEAQGLTAVELQTRLAVLPEVGRHVFLRQLSEMLSQGHPFEARFTVQNSLIVHPADGWIATNTPMLVIKRVCQSDAMASAVSVREIDGAQAEERAQRLGMPPRELDVFLWELVAATLDLTPARPALPQPF